MSKIYSKSQKLFGFILVVFLLSLSSIVFASDNSFDTSKLNCGEQNVALDTVKKIFSKIEQSGESTEQDLNAILASGACVRSLLESLSAPTGASLAIFIFGNKMQVSPSMRMEVSIPYSPSKGRVRSYQETIAILIHEWTHLFHFEQLLPGNAALNIESQPLSIKQIHNFYFSTEMLDIRAPFMELFADTVAMVAFGHPQVMSDANDTGGFTRDFSTAYTCDANRKGNHDLLDPLRIHIWQFYKKNIKSSRQRVLFLYYLNQLLNQEMGIWVRQMKRPNNPCELNSKLIDEFYRTFRNPSLLQ